MMLPSRSRLYKGSAACILLVSFIFLSTVLFKDQALQITSGVVSYTNSDGEYPPSPSSASLNTESVTERKDKTFQARKAIQQQKQGVLRKTKDEKRKSVAANFSQKDHNERNGVPRALKNLIKDKAELQGRHSDYIYPPCRNESGLPGSVTEEKYGFLGPFPYMKNYKNPCWLPKGAKRINCVPYFYLIGAPKAGSTDVFNRIQAHTATTQGKAKEVRWFDRLRFSPAGAFKGMPTFQEYLDFFDAADTRIQEAFQTSSSGKEYHHRILGDGSPTYYYSSYNWQKIPGNEGCTEPRVTAMSHIHHLWPKAKIIMVLRNPITRLFSTYLYNTHLMEFNCSAAQFDQWVKQSMDIWYTCLSQKSFRSCMYDRDVILTESRISTFAAGIYSRYILDLLKLFPRKQIYMVHLESYTANITKTLPEIYQFLELPPMSDYNLERASRKDNAKRMNRGKNYDTVPDMWPSTRKLLEEFYAPYNAELSAIFDEDPRWLWQS